MNPLTSIFLNVCLAFVFIAAIYIVIAEIKKRLANRTENPLIKKIRHSHFKENYWSLVRAYRDRVVARFERKKE